MTCFMPRGAFQRSQWFTSPFRDQTLLELTFLGHEWLTCYTSVCIYCTLLGLCVFCAQREPSRYLVDNGLVVEQVAASRKMRHIFLFNDVFICARQKVSGRSVSCDFLIILSFDSWLRKLICCLILTASCHQLRTDSCGMLWWLNCRQLAIVGVCCVWLVRTSGCTAAWHYYEHWAVSDTLSCVLLCCRERVTFELKWYIPVCDLQLDQTSNVQGLSDSGWSLLEYSNVLFSLSQQNWTEMSSELNWPVLTHFSHDITSFYFVLSGCSHCELGWKKYD